LDSITHTLFGLSLYSSIHKEKMSKREKVAYLFTTVGASQIPDSDVISQMWDTEGLYQMWHRGITHSIFLTPVWALLFFIISVVIFKVKDPRLFFIGWIAVVIHNTSDLFNAWGTGYLEPFSNIRITFGTIPIIDFIIWIIITAAYLFSRKNKSKRPIYFRIAWCLIALHFTLQSIQGIYFYHKYSEVDGQIALSAGFVPSTFQIITKNGSDITIFEDGIFQKGKKSVVLESKENADLDLLFSKRPEAKTLYEWSPFVVIVDDGKQLGLYDPRFYRDGQSFLFEYIIR
jgi:inner membrane protein